MKKSIRMQGFTLIEVMVVLLIIGIMASFVVPQFLGETDTARQKKVLVDISTLESSMQRYKLTNNVFPTTEQGLEALVNEPTIEPVPRNYPKGGYLPRLPLDPWGNDYQLLSPGEMGEFDIFSVGPDGEPGTEDDIGNWNMHETSN